MAREFVRYMRSCVNNIKVNLKGMGHQYIDCIFRLMTESSDGLSKHSNSTFHERHVIF